MRFFYILVPIPFHIWITSNFLYHGRYRYPISSYSDVPQMTLQIQVTVSVYWIGGHILKILHFHLHDSLGNCIFFLSFLHRGSHVVQFWIMKCNQKLPGEVSLSACVFFSPFIAVSNIPYDDSICLLRRLSCLMLSHWTTKHHLLPDFQLYKIDK